MTSFNLKPIKMSIEEQKLMADSIEEAETRPGNGFSDDGAGDETYPRGSHAATISSPEQHLRPPSKPGKKERTTWAGSGERSNRQLLKGHDQERQDHSPRHYLPSEGMYVLYEDQDISRTPGSSYNSTALSPLPYMDDSVQVDGGRMGRSRDNSSNTFIGEIDGRYSFSEGHVDEYVRVEITADGTSTSHELMECKRTVLKPYLIFLKVIGWRRLRESIQDLRRSRLHSCLNVIYPMFIFLMLTATIIIQQTTCFSRTLPARYRTKNQSEDSHLLVDCSEHIVVSHLVGGVFILCAYLYGIYLFRYGEPEHLSALIETVFLSYSQEMSDKRKKIIWVLRSYLVLGFLWIVLDFILSGVRMYSLQLLSYDTFNPNLRIPPGHPYNSTTHHSTDESILRFVLILFLPFGFVFYDVLYFSVVVAYASQCQLIQYYITSIMEKVRTKAYSLEDAIKDIRQTYTYIQVLNSKLSTLTTFIFFLFLVAALPAISSLAKFPRKDSFKNSPVFYVGIMVGLGNIFQWTILAAVPLVQAARLTSRCRQLRRLGVEIASRPFVYTGTPQLDLSYFLQYTNSTRYTAKLATVPIYPWMVVGTLFLGGIIGSYIISTNNHFVFARWF